VTAPEPQHVCKPTDVPDYGDRRRDCPVDGTRWIYIRRMVDRKSVGEWRKMLGQSRDDAAVEQELNRLRDDLDSMENERDSLRAIEQRARAIMADAEASSDATARAVVWVVREILGMTE
jgi:hypothetical protein